MTTAVVICPGRGTYNAAELGYIGEHFPDAGLLAGFDALRQSAGQETLSALDGAERFSMAKHTRGDNASGLIYAASYGDFLSIAQDIEIVGVTGNSMGWYTTLACAGAFSAEHGFRVANTMGTLMQEAMIGGQTLHPWMGEDWVADPDCKQQLLALVHEIGLREECELHLSIDLGGMLVVAGDEAGLKAFEASVEPAQGRFPMRLGNHAAFHTPMQEPVAAKGRAALPPALFGQPAFPMIDGNGRIWWPGACDVEALYDYTLGAQVTQAYSLTRAIAVAAREFAPDLFVILGPGATLGGAVAQSLIAANWRSMASKQDFLALQGDSPIIVSMGMQDQRALVASTTGKAQFCGR